MYRSLVLLLLVLSCERAYLPVVTGKMLLDEDPALFWSAVFNLPGGQKFYDNPGLWQGQSAGTFSKQLYSDEKKRIVQRLDEHLANQDPYVQQEYC